MPHHSRQNYQVKMFYIILLCCVSGALSVSVPSFITPCAIDDNSCILKSANAAMPHFMKGVPEMGIEPLDPMYIPRMASEDAALKLIFTENQIRGLSTCNITSVKSELRTKNSHSMVFKCPNINIEGNYKIDGHLIIFSIQGEGKSNIDMRDVVMKVTSNMTTTTGKDGKPHYHIVNMKHSFKVLTKTTFKLENLFNGNKAVADPIIQYMNENWKDVMEETAEPIRKVIFDKSKEVVNKIYKHVPIDELYNL